MYNTFKIFEILPPLPIVSVTTREVLFEKHKTLQLKQTYERLQKTFLKRGEYIWFANCNTFEITKYVIAKVPTEIIYRQLDRENRITFFSRSGKDDISIGCQKFLDSFDAQTAIPVQVFGVSDKQLICSSQQNAILALKIYIPQAIKMLNEQIQNSIEFQSAFKVFEKRKIIQKLSKLQKKINRFLLEKK